MKPEHSVTIMDVARAAGVHYSTVSLALREDPRVRADTVERVREAARTLGYRRDPLFAALAERRTRGGAAKRRPVLAVVRQAAVDGSRPVSEFNRAALRRRAEELGYLVSEHWREDHPSAGALARILRARGVAGVVFEFVRDEAFVRDPAWGGFALVARNIVDRALPVDAVRTDYFEATLGALRRMHAHGYRRVGVVCSQLPSASDEDLAVFGAAYAGLSELGMARRILRCGLSEPERVEAWMKTCGADAVLMRRAPDLLTLTERGLRVPGDMPVAVGMIAQEWLDVPCAGMVHRNAEVASGCVERLDQLIRYGKRGVPQHPESIVHETVWRDGSTLPPRA